MRLPEFSSTPPPFLKPDSRPTGRRRTGLKYEAQVHEEFERRYPTAYTPCPWIRYWIRGRERWCQPDGLLIDPRAGKIVVVEVKLQHTQDAIRQLFDLYIPLIEEMFESLYRVAGLEVVRWFDGTLATSMRPILCAEPQRARLDCLNVHIYEGH